VTDSVGSECIGTTGCFTSPDRFGVGLSRARGKLGVLHIKPLRNIDEVSITLVTGGPHGQKEVNMSKVFVLDTNHQPLDPVHPGRARLLLKAGMAAVYRRFPFTLILKHALEHPTLHPLRLKIDPGSQTTGLALVNDASGEVVWAAELSHRGQQIKARLDQRRAARRSRRQRKTRYRQPRFSNRRRRTGTLPPSLQSRVCHVLTWVGRLMRLCPVRAISQELVRFDTQALEEPDIEGVQYQRGLLVGYEVREYVLLKWNHQCAYCDASQVPLELDHIHPRSKGGSHRVSNLTLACRDCNQRKGDQDLRAFLRAQPERLARVLAQVKAPLRDAAAVNTTRWELYERLKALGVPVECGSGGCTKFNRITRGLPKAHWLDAACVGKSTPQRLEVRGIVPWKITATGHGSRQMCRMDRFGFPRTAPKQHKRVEGFQTGDLVRAVVTSGSKRGTYAGKVAVRSSGRFNITTSQGIVQGIARRFCRLIGRSDGYSYSLGKEVAFPPAA
jgi:5-methylcytosine-specific restriction endonuclease McrA